MPDLTRDEIAAWLTVIGKDRFWLAEKCGSTKHTVDSWFSTRGFPRPALVIIERLMRDTGHGITADLSRIQFTIAEWEHIERAREKAGYIQRQDFFRDAIVEKADRIRQAEASNITDLPKVADDDGPQYSASGDADRPA